MAIGDLNWSDEHYVRLYTRNSVQWLMLSIDAQWLYVELKRHADLSGVLSLGGLGLEAVSAIVGRVGEAARVLAALGELVDRKVVDKSVDKIVIPDYIEQETAAKTPRARKAESRNRHRSSARENSLLPPEGPVTKRDQESRNVTGVDDHNGIPHSEDSSASTPDATFRDQESRFVTKSHDNSSDVTRQEQVTEEEQVTVTVSDPEASTNGTSSSAPSGNGHSHLPEATGVALYPKNGHGQVGGVRGNGVNGTTRSPGTQDEFLAAVEAAYREGYKKATGGVLPRRFSASDERSAMALVDNLGVEAVVHRIRDTYADLPEWLVHDERVPDFRGLVMHWDRLIRVAKQSGGRPGAHKKLAGR